jgi:hypothetical protein
VKSSQARVPRHAPGQTTDAVSNPGGFYSTSHLTLGNMRANGVRSLDLCCWQCHHRAILSAGPRAAAKDGMPNFLDFITLPSVVAGFRMARAEFELAWDRWRLKRSLTH